MIIKPSYEIQEEFIDHIGSGNDACTLGTDLRKAYNGMELVEHVPREYKCRPHNETSGRDSNGQLLIHPTRFPNGLEPVVNHIHSLGFKAGIYSDAGRNTCGNFWDKDENGAGVGLYGHDQQDADFFFKDLKFDFIKVDFCDGDAPQNTEHLDLDERERYTAIRHAIDKITITK